MIKKLVMLVTIWLIFSLWSFYWVRTYISDVYFKKSQVLLVAKNVEKALEYSDKSIKFNSKEPNYYRGRAKILTVSIVGMNDYRDIKERILSDLVKAEELNPKNLVTLRNSVPIYYFLAVEDIFSVSGIQNLDSNYIGVTKDFYKKVKNNYSHDVGVVTLLAKYEKKLGLDVENMESREIINDLRPDLLEWHESLR